LEQQLPLSRYGPRSWAIARPANGGTNPASLGAALNAALRRQLRWGFGVRLPVELTPSSTRWLSGVTRLVTVIVVVVLIGAESTTARIDLSIRQKNGAWYNNHINRDSEAPDNIPAGRSILVGAEKNRWLLCRHKQCQ
jgi:hypothetical protein